MGVAIALVMSMLMLVVPWQSDAGAWDEFRLGNKCQPIGLIVESIDGDGAKMGLTQEDITTTVRSRLRAARIYRDLEDRVPYLYVNILVVETAFNISLEFNKWLSDPISGREQFGTTWDKSVTGRTSGADYVLSSLSRRMDQFIDEYLRVNELACQEKTAGAMEEVTVQYKGRRARLRVPAGMTEEAIHARLQEMEAAGELVVPADSE